ncbi:MAG: site-specific integrase [Desulfobacterales bacterium]
MATVVIQKRPRENGSSYVITYKDPNSGRKRYYKTLRKAKDARQAANDLRYLLDNGKIASIRKDNRKTRLLTLAQVCDGLKQEWQDKAGKDDLASVTLDGYFGRSNQITKVFGNRILCEITQDEVREYRDSIAQNTSNANANRILFVFKQIFSCGERLGAITESPISDIKMLSEKAHERNGYLMPDELTKIINMCQRVNSKYYLPAIILLGAEHGASKQEALSLRWSDIKFEYEGKGLIRFFRTKNKRERTEILMPRTRKALLTWRNHLNVMRAKRGIQVKDDTYVSCRLDGNRLKGFTSGWRRVRKLAGFDDLHFHDLRHTFCSNLMLAGANIKDVKDMIGHSEIKMTDRYTHLTDARKVALHEKLADHYDGMYSTEGNNPLSESVKD